MKERKEIIQKFHHNPSQPVAYHASFLDLGGGGGGGFFDLGGGGGGFFDLGGGGLDL